MIKDVATAFERRDYGEAHRLLYTLPPQEPWVILYRGRLCEVTDDWDEAEATYRGLLRTDNGPKITLEARQGLQRLEALRKEQRQQAIAKAIAEPANTELGVLILEPLVAEAKFQAAQNFARVMKIDTYAARLLIPSRGWRLYRSGRVGELNVYGQELQAVGIPLFWFSLVQIQQVQVFQVCYFESVAAQVKVSCAIDSAQAGPIPFTFEWTEITQRVEGLLPIFEEVVDRDPRGKLQRKQKTQDHAQFCDLHLPSRNCILRIYDSAYQFNQGISLISAPSQLTHSSQGTSWANWKNLMEMLNLYLPNTPVWSDFTSFAETAIEHTELLDHVNSHINLFRRTDSYWDPAFHLYSCLVFLKS